MNSSKSSDDDSETIAAFNELRNEFGPSWKDPAQKSESAPADFCSLSPSKEHSSDFPCGESLGMAALLYTSTC